VAAPAGLGVCRQRGKFYAALVEDLLDFAEHEFRFGDLKSDGTTERDHQELALATIAALPKWRGAKPAIQSAPPFPVELNYLWGWFCEHSMGLSSNGMGPALVTWESLNAWCSQMDIELKPREARAMVRLGHLRAIAQSEKKPVAQSPDKPGRKRR
jgi:hypothetical protein